MKPGKLTLLDYPRIVLWCHPSKNGGSQPKDYKHASYRRVWLQCRGCTVCGEVHEWSVRVEALTRGGDSIVCPSCESWGGSFCTCTSVADDERLAAEWHEDNPSAYTIALGNRKKYTRRCSEAGCGKVWEASPAHRSTFGNNCPGCAKTNQGRFTYASLADGRPDLVPEWDWGRNGCPATEVTCGSGKMAWWICRECGVSWQTRVVDRVSNGNGCSRCQQMFRGQPRNFFRG